MLPPLVDPALAANSATSTSSTSSSTASLSNAASSNLLAAAIFSRVVSSLCYILKHFLAKKNTLSVVDLVNHLRYTMSSAFQWCDKEVQNIQMLYQEGKHLQALRPQKTTTSTFSSNHVVLDLLRSGRPTMFNASSTHNETTVHVASSLCLLENMLSMLSTATATTTATELLTPDLMGMQQRASLWCTSEALQIIAQAHWKTLRGEPGLKCMHLSNIPMYFKTKVQAFNSAVLESRGRIFAGRGGKLADATIDLKVDRSSLIPTSMREIIKILSTHDFPYFRRSVSTLRVTFLREQGSGPGVTRGWFAAVTHAIQTLDQKFLQKIGGGQTSPIAPTYMKQKIQTISFTKDSVASPLATSSSSTTNRRKVTTKPRKRKRSDDSDAMMYDADGFVDVFVHSDADGMCLVDLILICCSESVPPLFSSPFFMSLRVPCS